MMEASDILRLALRWVHTLAAVAWVGGSAFYALVLRPTLRNQGDPGQMTERAIGQEFREVVQTAIVALVVTGVVLTFDRLSTGAVGSAYVAVLGLKVALVLWMAVLAQRLGRRPTRSQSQAEEVPVGTRRRPLEASRLVLLLGLIVLLLADLLRELYEAALRG